MKSLSVRLSLLSLLLMPLIVACSPTHVSPSNLSIQDAGLVLFSKITIRTTAKGLKVSGAVRKRSPGNKLVKIPGHIHIILTDTNGKTIRSMKARTHRQYGNSKQWHFDGTLQGVQTTSSTILVKYHIHDIRQHTNTKHL